MKRVCVRCEMLDRPQKSKSIHYMTLESGEKVPMCATCLLEIKEEEDFLESLSEENDGSGEDVIE
jgi:hypothetical protein